ncbi:MAG TPA: carboxypeptidase regulatory-like domain-containing protein [Vicinamibacterales bacterium]|nr:carboxypeptidase regulatory-like domain-containing protein [Vicinamibacterales bacterium]
MIRVAVVRVPRGLALSCFALFVLFATSFAGACGGSSSSTPAGSSGASTAGKRVDVSTAGSISGRVLFEGTAPAPALLNVSADAKCSALDKAPRDESVLVRDGGLENVFVYVKDGLSGYTFDAPPDPATLDQDGCVYLPHVLGVRVGQPLEVSNSDPATHNVHAAARVNQPFNTAQPFKGMVYTHRFSKPEVAVPFKCDVHPWMLAYVGVVEHPYFDVTRNGGRFDLEGLPPGTYTVEAWHEKYGTQTAKITLGDKESKDLSFTFKAS